MKKIYQLILLFAASAISSGMQAQYDAHNFAQGQSGPSALFANDVIIAPSGMKQHGTSLTVAFNGWLYEATGTETMDSDSSGGIVRMSKDNGFTWTTCVSYLYPNVDYISPEIEVAGTDTNNLFLFVAGSWYDSTSGAADVWVDKYNARNGAFISEVYSEAFQYPVRDLDLATDYKHPAWLASPYSVGLLYSHFGSLDSVIFVSSGDGGNTWSNRKAIAGTSNYFDHVSLAYGISSNWGNGRYFAAWEERSSFSATTIGKIKTAHCASVFNGVWTSPFCLDSLDPAISGVARRPRISCLENNATSNDSNGVTVDVVFERAFGGDTADCDIIGFYSKSQPAGNFWYRFDVANNSSQTLQPDISFDPAYNNFLLTYFNRTGQAMPYLVHDFNMVNPATWVTITSNYCDQPSTVKDPFPRVVINPALVQAAFSWTRQATPAREQAMFDAEYMVTAIPAAAFGQSFSLYPNPAQQQALLAFDLANTEEVRIDVYDMGGRLVLNVLEGSMSAGPQQVAIPCGSFSNGTYLVSVTSGSFRKTVRLAVAN